MSNPILGILVYSNPDYYPPTVNAVHLLSKHFDVVLIGRNQAESDRIYPTNVTIHRLGKYSSVRQRETARATAKFQEYISFIQQTRKLLKQASLIYAYDGYAFVAAMLCCLTLAKKIPIIYHSHEISDKIPAMTSLGGWISRAERKWIHQADVVVFPDQDRADFFQKATQFPQLPVIVPNFPLKSIFTFQEDWALLIQQRWHSATLFYRGSISDVSAMREIISSVSLVEKKTKQDLSVQYVGFLQDKERQTLEHWVGHIGADSYFSYLGTLPYDDLQSYTLSATIGFALYKSTSFDRVACASACNKIYEYAACGLPTIVSDFSTYRDYLADEPWVRFANPEDPQSIAIAVENILSDPEQYRTMCLAARQSFEEKFNFEAAFAPLMSMLKTYTNHSVA
jgi:glycosyltransferase involved in cell wall biosynthesis